MHYIYCTYKASALILMVAVIHTDADIPPSVEISGGASSLSSQEGWWQLGSDLKYMMFYYLGLCSQANGLGNKL